MNICQAIKCPYFSDNYKTSWGCQRYNVALLCHLLKDKDNLRQTSTQYALHGEGYDVSTLKQQNEVFLSSDPKYIQDKSMKESGFLDSDQPPFHYPTKAMFILSSSPSTYQEALDLINALNKSGISANITSGGVSIQCQPDQVNKVQEICQAQKAPLNLGFTPYEEDVLLSKDSKSGRELIEKTVNDTLAVVAEWRTH